MPIPTPTEEMEIIDVTLEICTIYKNKPFGPAIIKHESFIGAGEFDEEGKLKKLTARENNG
jgi:hypothetical protein